VPLGPGFGQALCVMCVCWDPAAAGKPGCARARRQSTRYRLEGGKAVEEGKEGEKGGGGDAAMCKEVNQFDVCLFEYKVN